MEDKSREWLRQAEYDMNTAEFMFDGARYFYAVFMCHLSIEKALKGLYYEKLKKVPPKVHNLVYLLNKIDLKPPEPLSRFVVKLNEANIATRYPENLGELQKNYTEKVVKDIILKSKEVLTWIKEMF
ncbi:MAG: HEPN domain-containing protein [Nitrospirota bacterium]